VEEVGYLNCDVSKLLLGRTKLAEPVRHCQISSGRNVNVVLTPKEGTVKTWGIRVKEGYCINKGEEIFIRMARPQHIMILKIEYNI